MNSTKDAIDSHIRCFRAGDIEGVLNDFSAEAVLFTPSGTVRGQSQIKSVFQKLLAEFGNPGGLEIVYTAIFDGDYLSWCGETADNYYEFATDTFVVQDGKIVAQSFASEGHTKAVREGRTSLKGSV